MSDSAISDGEQKWYEHCAEVIAILPEDDRAAFLNDMLRTVGVGGRVVVTPGIAALPDDARAAALDAARPIARRAPLPPERSARRRVRP